MPSDSSVWMGITPLVLKSLSNQTFSPPFKATILPRYTPQSSELCHCLLVRLDSLISIVFFFKSEKQKETRLTRCELGVDIFVSPVYLFGINQMIFFCAKMWELIVHNSGVATIQLPTNPAKLPFLLCTPMWLLTISSISNLVFCSCTTNDNVRWFAMVVASWFRLGKSL